MLRIGNATKQDVGQYECKTEIQQIALHSLNVIDNNGTTCDINAMLQCIDPLSNMGSLDSPQDAVRICSTIYPEMMACIDNIPPACLGESSFAQIQMARQQLDTMCGMIGGGGEGESTGGDEENTPCDTGVVMSCMAPVAALGNTGGNLEEVMKACSTVFPEFVSCMANLPPSCSSDPLYAQAEMLKESLKSACGMIGGGTGGEGTNNGDNSTLCDTGVLLNCLEPVTSVAGNTNDPAHICSTVFPAFVACIGNLSSSCTSNPLFSQIEAVKQQLETACGMLVTTPPPCGTEDIENGEPLLWPMTDVSGSSTNSVSECIAAVCRPPMFGTITEAAVTARISEEEDYGFYCNSYDKGAIVAVLESPGKTVHRCMCPGINCGQSSTMCSTSGECIVNESVCDGHPDCSDNSDEDNCDELVIKTERDGNGIVMMKYRSLTTLVCDQDVAFTDREAGIICKAMGFRGGNRSSSGRKVLDTQAWLSLTCSETATTMSECEQEWLVSRYACASMMPASVNCYT